jgi:hypothetical protein
MNFKRFSIAGALAAIVPITLFAQGLDPQQMAERQVAHLKEQLELTDEQVPKVKKIVEDNIKQMMELREKHPFTPGEPPSQEARDAMAKAREESNGKMAKVLTEAQMEKYQKIQRERGIGFGKGGGRKAGKQ